MSALGEYKPRTRLPEVKWRKLPVRRLTLWERLQLRFSAAVEAWKDAA